MVFMNVTLSIDDELVKKVRKIAVDRDTTLTAMVRDYLLTVANEETAFGRKQLERKALEKTFREIEFRIGDRSWTRQDLYERS